MMWFLAFMFNGLAVLSVEPFESEEGCALAAREANVAHFECLPVPEPELEEETEQ